MLRIEREVAQFEIDGQSAGKPLLGDDVTLAIHRCYLRQQHVKAAIIDDEQARRPDLSDRECPQIFGGVITDCEPRILPLDLDEDIDLEQLLAVVDTANIQQTDEDLYLVGLAAGNIVFDGKPGDLNESVLTQIYGEEDWSTTVGHDDQEDEDEGSKERAGRRGDLESEAAAG